MKNNNWVLTAGIAIVVGAAAFFGGIQYQKMQLRSNFQGMMGGQIMMQGGASQGNRMFGTGSGARGGRNGSMAPIVGEVVSQDANSITVKLQDGSSKIVNIAGSTTISKTDTGVKEDIKVGSQIAAFGSTNSDGSITAQNLQLNPMFRMGTRGAGTPMPSK